MNLSTLPRNQKEQLAGALVEKSRRRVGLDTGAGYSAHSTNHLDLLTWTILNRRMLAPGLAFDLVHHPYLVEIYQCQAQRKVFNKSSQMGLSEYAISYIFHAAAERDATVLYLFPTDSHVSDFSAGRVGTAIEASDYLNNIIIDAAGNDKRGADRVTLKRVRNRFVYFRGGQVKPNGQAPQLKSIAADVLVYDELDETDPRVPAIAEKRLGHSLIGEEIFISTPTYPGFGIDAVWRESDQRVWHVRCAACGAWQPLTADHIILEYDELERPTHWHGQAEGRAFAACQKCGRELDRLAAGRWVATYPERKLAGFHVTKLFSPRVNLLSLVTGLQTTDETKRRECKNQDWGEPYTPRGGQLTEGTLDACRRGYGHGPVPGEETFMGVDVGRVLHVVIRGSRNQETGERAQRFAGEVESWERLAALTKQFNVKRCVIDALPETTKAREFQEAMKGRVVFLCYYSIQAVGLKSAEPVAWDVAKGLVNTDRTRTLDETFSRFYPDQNGQVVNTLPGGARDIRDYYAHLKAPVRVVEDGPGGQKVSRYVEGANPDHLAHAENYCTIASMAPVVPNVVPVGLGKVSKWNK